MPVSVRLCQKILLMTYSSFSSLCESVFPESSTIALTSIAAFVGAAFHSALPTVVVYDCAARRLVVTSATRSILTIVVTPSGKEWTTVLVAERTMLRLLAVSSRLREASLTLPFRCSGSYFSASVSVRGGFSTYTESAVVIIGRKLTLRSKPLLYRRQAALSFDSARVSTFLRRRTVTFL